MAFGHFHKYSARYLAVFLALTLFSLLTFNVTGAMTTLAAKLFGGTGGARFTFQSSSGAMVNIDDEAIAIAAAELPGAVAIFEQVEGYSPYSALGEGERTWAHFMLLADADELGIVAPPERARELVTRFKQFVQRRNPEVQLTVTDFAAMLARSRLNEGRLEARLGELCRIEALMRAQQGVRVVDPVRLAQLFTPKGTKVGLDYVELSFERFKAELAAAPPADADLETWFKGLAADVIEEKYTRGERYTVDFVLVDANAFDPATVPADLVPPTELTDDDYFAEGKRDPLRYFGDRLKVPATAADVTPEARAKIKKDRHLKATLEKLRSEYDVAVAALPAIEPAKPDADDAAKQAAEAALAERVAKEAAAFAEQAKRFGFAVTTVADQEMKQLAELDPPKDSSLQFMVRGLSAPGSAGIRTQSVLPTGERTHGYVVRLAAAAKPAEPKPFAEVKGDVLAHWIEEHAKEKALAKGEELLALLLADGEKALPGATLAAYAKERDEALAKVETDKTLDDDGREAQRSFHRRSYARNVQSVARAAYSARFADHAKALGLEVKSLAPQRRDVSSSWFFNDRFSGAERFLLRQNRFAQDGSGEPMVMALRTGAVLPQVLVNDADNAAYVAMVRSRELPTPEAMTAKDREAAERELKSEWSRLDNPMMFGFQRLSGGKLPVYENPFAMAQLIRRHHPKTRVNQGTTSFSPDGYY